MMPHGSIYDDPSHWRKCAKEIRAIADVMNKTEMKAIMLRIAKDYDQLAELASLAVSKVQSEDD